MTPRTYAHRVGRASCCNAAQKKSLESSTPGKRPVNPGIDESLTAPLLGGAEAVARGGCIQGMGATCATAAKPVNKDGAGRLCRI